MTRHPDDPLPGARQESPALDRLLRSAAAPAHAEELSGLAVVLDALAQAQPSRRSVKSALTRVIAAKAMAAVIVGTALGGVSLAAAEGTLPGPLQDVAHDAVGAPAAHRSHPSHPSPNLVGLCHAYTAQVATAKGKALDNPAFTALIAAAGSKRAVPQFCEKALAAAATGKPSPRPTPRAKGKPTTHPTPHATGKPSTHPTRHATGKPTSHPTAHSSHARAG